MTTVPQDAFEQRPRSGGELLSRARKIRLKQAAIAREANLDQHAVGRIADGNVHYATFRDAAIILQKHELDLLAHLATLYPDQAMRAATVALCPQKAGAAS